MRTPFAHVARIAGLMAFCGLVGSAGGGTTIVVDVGGHASAAAAANSEAKVNWRDADTRDDRICTECFAAVELQRALRLATGRKDDFAVVDDDAPPPGGDLIVVGEAHAKFKRLGPQGYRIHTVRVGKRRVTVLAGGDRVGTLYAVYDLLHRLGCRWFAPGALHEEIPKVDAIGDFDVTAKPSFLTRGFHAWENRGDEAFLLWMARNRLNYWCVEQENHPLIRKLGIRMSCGAHDAQKRFLDPEAVYPYDHPRFEGDAGKPADPYGVNPAYSGDANKNGKLTYFEAHPRWFPLVGGKRISNVRGDGGTNYCTSNTDATAEFMKNYVQALTDGAYRDADVVRFWTLDVGKWCGCGACKALGTRTDRNLLLVYHLDRAIKRARSAGKINRPLTIRFLAYADVLAPPTRPLPKDFDYDTCSATYFPIHRSYVYDFLDPRNPKNAQYHRQLVGWVKDPKRHYRGRLCIGEYYNVSGYKCLPISFMHVMARDIPTYYRLGARRMHYMHCTTGNMGNKALTNYQMARQLWDVQTDCEALWRDYFARRYGPAAETMRAFHESLEKMFSNVTALKYGLARRLNRGAKDLTCTPMTIAEIVAAGQKCRKLIDRALAAKLPPRIRGRIAEDERLFTYGERTIRYYHECIQAFEQARAGRRESARKHFDAAKRVAALLRADTTSTKLSSSHASAANAFVATYATGALPRLAALLDKPEK